MKSNSISRRFYYMGLLVSAATLCLSPFGCDYFPESTFELSRDSRLPKWFALSPGVSRLEAAVTMSYYSGRTVTFILRDAKDRKLAEVNGTTKGHEPRTLKNPPPGFPPGYPAYEIITVNGMTEIIEHRQMEPIFYITDDPAVWAELGVSR